jgi:hypothetical protein
MIGASIQAAIAYIREHAPGTPSSGITGGADYNFTRPTPKGGGVTQNVKRMLPGTVVDVSSGLKYTSGPVGAGSGQSFLTIAQGGLRRLGVRFQMPEYMISGDASNANYASTLVASSPFVRAMQARQYVECEQRKRMVWGVLAHAVAAGVFERYGILSIGQLRRAVELNATLPDIAEIDQASELARDQFDHSIGAISAQTIAERRGYDYQAEVDKGAKAASGGFSALPGSGLLNDAAMREALREATEKSWEGYP